MKKSIDFDTAVAIMEGLPYECETEDLPLVQALDRVLAQDLYAAFPMPPFPKSPFDGFAVSSQDLPATLPVTGVIAAGENNISPLAPGTAVRIFTGSPVPPGADVVVKQEDVIYDNSKVTIDSSYPSGYNVIPQGEEMMPGDLLARSGQHLSPAALGLLASQGIGTVRVYRKPKVIILSTGSELSPPGTTRSPYGIYNSSYYTLRGYLEKMGFLVESDQIIPDDPIALADAAKAAMDSDSDLVITTGGASVGDYDFAISTASTIGAKILFWKVRMKPGGALLVSQKSGKILLGLSGNPAAALMCLLTVLEPYLRKLTGSPHRNQKIMLPILHDMPKTSSVPRLLRGHTVISDGIVFFEEHKGQRNGNLSSFDGCSVIGMVPGHSEPLHAGDPITVYVLGSDML